MAPAKPATGATAPTVPSTPSTKTVTAKPGKPAKRTDLHRVLDHAQNALRSVRRIHKVASAWLAVLKAPEAPPADAGLVASITKVVHATEEKAINRLVEAEQVAQALVEALWVPPVVKVTASGERPFEKGDKVCFRAKQTQKMVARGIATAEELAELQVLRVTKGKDGDWVTAISTKTQNHFGPRAAYELKHL